MRERERDGEGEMRQQREANETRKQIKNYTCRDVCKGMESALNFRAQRVRTKKEQEISSWQQTRRSKKII